MVQPTRIHLDHDSLMYNARLDIAHVVGRLNWYNQSPNQDHLNIIYKIVKYLGGTDDCNMCYSEFPYVLKVYNEG